MRKVRLYYPTCMIEGYINDQGEYADMDGVLMTMTIAPERIVVEPGELPDMPFLPYVEIDKTDVPVLVLPTPVIKLRQLLNSVEFNAEKITFEDWIGELRLSPQTIELAEILGELPEPEQVHLVEILGELKTPEKTIELLKLLNKLPEEKQTELLKILNQMEEQVVESEWEDIEVNDELQDILMGLYEKYGNS